MDANSDRAWGASVEREDERESATPESRERDARWMLWAAIGRTSAAIETIVALCDGEVARLWDGDDAEELRREVLGRLRDAGQAQVARALTADPSAALATELAKLPAGAWLLYREDAAYPASLLELKAPPLFLYVWGAPDALLARASVAVVGSRRASVAMIEHCHRMSSKLGAAGVVVVSGGALGVDTAAHEGCLGSGGRSVAFVAGGLDRLTPTRNAPLFERLAGQGAVVSEYPAGVAPRAFHYARRNELIAALSQAVVVVRAAHDSGTMLTATAARTLNRPLLVVPGDPGDPHAAGSNALLVEGASAVVDGRDVLVHLEHGDAHGGTLQLPFSERRTKPRRADGRPRSRVRAPDERSDGPGAPRARVRDTSGLSERGRELLAAIEQIGAGEAHLDQLARQTGWDHGALGTGLLELELGGFIAKVGGMQAYRCL